MPRYNAGDEIVLVGGTTDKLSERDAAIANAVGKSLSPRKVANAVMLLLTETEDTDEETRRKHRLTVTQAIADQFPDDIAMNLTSLFRDQGGVQ
jgi:hypothetical protein